MCSCIRSPYYPDLSTWALPCPAPSSMWIWQLQMLREARGIVCKSALQHRQFPTPLWISLCCGNYLGGGVFVQVVFEYGIYSRVGIIKEIWHPKFTSALQKTPHMNFSTPHMVHFHIPWGQAFWAQLFPEFLWCHQQPDQPMSSLAVNTGSRNYGNENEAGLPVGWWREWA